MHLDQELSVLRWARWARTQVDGWASSADPGEWDARAVLDAIATSAAAEVGPRQTPPT